MDEPDSMDPVEIARFAVPDGAAPMDVDLMIDRGDTRIAAGLFDAMSVVYEDYAAGVRSIRAICGVWRTEAGVTGECDVVVTWDNATFHAEVPGPDGPVALETVFSKERILGLRDAPPLDATDEDPDPSAPTP